MSKKLEITLSKSVIGKTDKQRKTVQALGLKKINDTIIREDTPPVRGMIKQVSHMVTVKEV